MFTPTKRTLSAAALIAALAAPSTASAALIGGGGSGPSSSGQLAQLQSYQQAVAKSFGPTPGGLAGPTVRAHTAAISSVRPTAASSPEGFQWDDAGIGAGGAVLLLSVGAGAAGAMRRRRVHRTAIG